MPAPNQGLLNAAHECNIEKMRKYLNHRIISLLMKELYRTIIPVQRYIGP